MGLIAYKYSQTERRMHLFRFAKRVLLLLLCLCLFRGTACAEGVQFTLRATLDPVQYDSEDRSLWEGAAAFLEAAAVSGVLHTDGGQFDLQAALTVSDGSRDAVIALYAAGTDSHWRIGSSLLGETELLLNNAALLEFGVKTNLHLGLPLQRFFLLYPYVHEHALEPVIDRVTSLFRPEGTERLVTAEELAELAAWIAAHYEESSALQLWAEAIGMDADCTHEIAAVFRSLPDYAAAAFPEGLTVACTDSGLTVCHLETEVMSLSRFDGTLRMNLMLPELLTLNLSTHSDSVFRTGSVHVASPLLGADVSYSLPASLPVIYPFYLTVDAQGALLGGDGLHLVLDGEAQGSTIFIRQLLPDRSQVASTLMLTLTQVPSSPVAPVDPEDPELVNVLSVTGDSLAALMADVSRPLLSDAFDLIRVTPPQACQAAMDCLDQAGVLDVLFTALMDGDSEY